MSFQARPGDVIDYGEYSEIVAATTVKNVVTRSLRCSCCFDDEMVDVVWVFDTEPSTVIQANGGTTSVLGVREMTAWPPENALVYRHGQLIYGSPTTNSSAAG